MSNREELLEEIEDTRARLGDTVEELARRLDVKSRAHDKIGAARETAHAAAVEVAETIQHGGSAAWGRARLIAQRRDAQLAAACLIGAVVLVTKLRH